MRWEKECARVQHQNSELVAGITTKQFFSTVSAEHAGSNNDDIERLVPVRHVHVLPASANAIPNCIYAKCRVLNAFFLKSVSQKLVYAHENPPPIRRVKVADTTENDTRNLSPSNL